MTDSVQKPVSLQLPDYGVWVAESVHGPTFRMGPERHDFHQIYVVQRGEVLLRDERLSAPVLVSAGSLWAIPKGIAHQMEDTAESILLLACLSEELLLQSEARSALWEALTTGRRYPIRPDTILFSQILNTMNQILAEQWQEQPGHSLLVGAELDRLLVRLARMHNVPAGNSAPDRVARVIALLDTQFYEVWDIDRASALAHLSRRRFTTVFRELTGTTFNDYLTRVRLGHAKALLRGGQHSIPGAAFASGMADISHFYRLFKKENGCTPGTWIQRTESGEMADGCEFPNETQSVIE